MLRLLALLSLCWLASPGYAADYRELNWNNLLAPGERPHAQPQANTTSQHNQVAVQPSAAVNPALDRHAISLSGYAVPLEGDGQTVTAFLLVPYFGACIHVPPPPTNQVVLVNVPGGVAADALWDAIKVSGRLHVESSHSDLANAGYRLEADAVTAYQAP
ncbi:MAG: DUF3299 domain-containing protein [Aeromonadaceae bacterium]